MPFPTLERYMSKFVISDKAYIDDCVDEFRKKLGKILIKENPVNENRGKYMYAIDISLVIEVIDD